MEVTDPKETRAQFAAIAGHAADLRRQAATAGAALPPELTAAAISVGYYLRQAELIASAIAGIEPGSR
jgi:hypothetical protein